MWRARSATGSTDDQGNAFVKVEALAEVPTHWIFSVPPVVIDGIRYESVDSIELTINPGVTDPSPILLRVISRKGKILGKLTENNGSEVSLKAVRLSTGDVYETKTSANGSFSFSDIQIDRYVLLADSNVDQENVLVYPQLVDLTVNREANINIQMLQFEGRSFHGRVIDEHNLAMPFGWVTIENSTYVQSLLPESGEFSILGLQGEKLNFQLRSPGYFSHETSVSLKSLPDSLFEVKLKPQDGTTFLPWGNGNVTLPAESELHVENGVITLEKGWVWGKGGGSDLMIRSSTTQIKLSDASFAYELLPNQSEWLFIFDGSAEIRSGTDLYKIGSEQMVNLSDKQTIMVIPYDPAILSALRPDKPVPVSLVREQTMLEKITGALQAIGVNFAQVIVYVVYIAGLIALIFFPVKIFIQWLRKKKLPN
jgi:hypothetical protein